MADIPQAPAGNGGSVFSGQTYPNVKNTVVHYKPKKKVNNGKDCNNFSGQNNGSCGNKKKSFFASKQKG